MTVISFLPQLGRLWLRKDSSGISLHYALYNLISTTEQFTIAFFYLVNDADDAEFFVSRPRTTGDWLNLCQLTLAWMLWLTL